MTSPPDWIPSDRPEHRSSPRRNRFQIITLYRFAPHDTLAAEVERKTGETVMAAKKGVGANGRGSVGERVIVLEFNELCPKLLYQWMEEGRLPAFKRLFERSAVFETLADEPEGPNLEPWIQWHSIHTGRPFREHGVFHLTEGSQDQGEDWYRYFQACGRSVASFGSMNVRPFNTPGSIFLADPWSEKGDASPSDLNLFNSFIARQIREYTNESKRPGFKDYAAFAQFLLRHGLSFETVSSAISQLSAERLQDRRLSYRRVAILDRILFDVFRALYRKSRPDFATFFLNSTAHLQHAYWRNLEPERFSVPPEDPEIYQHAIRFGYEAMDRLVAKLMTLGEDQQARLVLATALSQQPFLRYENSGGQRFYRFKDIDGFCDALGLPFRSLEPVMTHQYLAHCDTPEEEARAKEALEGLTCDGERALLVETAAKGGLYFGCRITRAIALDRVLDGLPAGMPSRLGDHLYRIDAMKSGRHHPLGALWIETGHHRRAADPVSILDIFPTMADLLNCRSERPLAGAQGESLIARF